MVLIEENTDSPASFTIMFYSYQGLENHLVLLQSESRADAKPWWCKFLVKALFLGSYEALAVKINMAPKVSTSQSNTNKNLLATKNLKVVVYVYRARSNSWF